MTKLELRKHIKEVKRHFSQVELREMSLGIIDKLLAHKRVIAADHVFMYYSLSDEVFTHDAVERLVCMGKSVLLPRVVVTESDEKGSVKKYDKRPSLTWHRYEKTVDLAVGSYSIMEPVTPTVNPDNYVKGGVVVVPGVAFDCNGNRLGRGKGYYDGFLVQYPDLYKIGVCFDFQLVPSVPAEEYDVKMDTVVV